MRPRRYQRQQGQRRQHGFLVTEDPTYSHAPFSICCSGSGARSATTRTGAAMISPNDG
jgi:hypothetical protein